MKYIVLLAIAFMLSFKSSSAQTGWLYLNSGVTKNLHSVDFVTSDFGIAVGDSGTALKTTDGGLTWQQMSFDGDIDLDNSTFKSVSFADTQTAVMAGVQIKSIVIDSGYKQKNIPLLLRTDDAGATWQKVNVNATINYDSSNYSFDKVCMANQSVGFAVLNGSYVGYAFKTVNGGKSWTIDRKYDGGEVYDLDCFKDNSYIVSTLRRGEPLSYTNAYLHWDVTTFRFSPQDIAGYGRLEVQSLGKDAWFVSSFQRKKDYRSFNDGVTWDSIDGGSGAKFHFYDGTKGYSFDGKTIAKTMNAGESWIAEKTPEDVSIINSLTAVDDIIAYAVGQNGTILKRVGATSVNDDTKLLKEIHLRPNPANDEIIFKSSAGNEIILINNLGQEVWRGTTESEITVINVAHLPIGAYVLKHHAGAELVLITR